MYHTCLKKGSKFLAVLLTAVLAFSPLSYAAPAEVSTYTDLTDAIADSSYDTINVNDSFSASDGDSNLGEQAADSLIINGNDNSVNGNSVISGMSISAGQTTNINDITFTNFKKDGDQGTVIFNDGGDVTIERSTFTSNVIVPDATSGDGDTPSGVGGVIGHDSAKQGGIRIGLLTIKNSYFGANQAFGAGAILSTGDLDIEDTTFEGNTADHFGAIAVMGSKDDSTVLTRVNFIGNQDNSSDNLPNAGAMFLGGEVDVKITTSSFTNNISIGNGGAINSEPLNPVEEEIKDGIKEAEEDGKTYEHYGRSYSKLDIVGSTFTGNEAANGKGGAINNYLYGSNECSNTYSGFETKQIEVKGVSKEYKQVVLDQIGYVYVTNSKFNENKARQGGAIYNNGNVDGISEAIMLIEKTSFENNSSTADGGAIYNEGTITFGPNVTFTGNNARDGVAVAEGKGGAIYNEGTINFDGDAVFENNYVNFADKLNDIYSNGTLNFNAGAITMTGGITGRGDTVVDGATVELDENADLEQNTLSIKKYSTLSVNVDKLKIASDDVANSGNLIFSTGTGTLQNNIIGQSIADPNNLTNGEWVTGTVTVKENANVTLGNNNSIDQDALIIEENGSFTSLSDGSVAPSINLRNGILQNDGLLTYRNSDINNGSEKTLTYAIQDEQNSGSKGKVVIDDKIIADNIIKQEEIEITEQGILTANADNIIAPITSVGIYNVTGGTVSYSIAGGTVQSVGSAATIPAGTVNIDTEEVTLDSTISGSTVNVSKELKLTQNANMEESALIIKDGAIINTQNDSTGEFAASAITIENNAQWIYSLDVNLAEQAQTADMLSSQNWSVGDGSSATITNIHFISEDTGTAKVLIANEKINSVIGLTRPYISTSNKIYYISTLENEDGTYLIFSPNEVSSLPIAISSAIPQYDFLTDEIVTEWENGNTDNFLKTDMAIFGGGYNLIGENGVEGIRTSSNTLTIENLAEFSGFNNALTVDEDGSGNTGKLFVSTVTFRNNTGSNPTATAPASAVIVNAGTTTLSNVVFEDNNNVDYDVINNNELVLTGSSTTFAKGISGTGTTKLENVEIDMGTVGIQQNQVIIAEDASLTAQAGNITLTSPDSAIQNAGTFTFSGGNINSVMIGGFGENYGKTIFAEGSNVTNNAEIKQASVTINGVVTNVSNIIANEIEITENGTLTTLPGNLQGIGEPTSIATTTVKNDGTLIFSNASASSTNRNNIIGTGSLTVGSNTTSSYEVINEGNISQSTITISAGNTFKNTKDGSVTTNNLEGNAFENNGLFVLDLKDGSTYNLQSLTYDDSDAGNVAVTSVTVANLTEGDSITLDLAGKTISQKQVEFYGGNTLNLQGDGSSKITANIINYVTGDSLHINNETIEGNFTNAPIEDVHAVFEENSAVTGKIYNEKGKIDILSDFTIQNGITSNYATVEYVANNILNIGSATAAGIVTTSTTIEYQNITISSGALTMNNAGTDGIISNSKITVAENGTLTVNASSVTLANASDFIANEGEIVFTGGTNNNNINEDNSSNIFNGTLTVTGDVTNVKKVYVSTVSVEGTATLTNNSTMETNYITGSNVENKDWLKLYLLDNEGYKLETLTGDGQLDIHNNVQASTMNISGKSLTQSSFLFYGDQELTVEGDSSTPTELVATGIGVSNYSAAGVKFENVAIKGIFSNAWSDDKAFFEDGTSVSGLIDNNGQLYIRKSNEPFVVEQGITGYSSSVATNLLYIGDAANDKAGIVVSSNTIEYQTITVSSGSLTMENGGIYGIIDNSAITVEENGELKVHASSMTNIVNKTVTNDGKVILVGNTTTTDNENAFVNTASGKGNLVIDGNINNKEGASITQSSVTVLATSTLTASASDIQTGTGIFNAGALVFKSTNTMTNNNLITGISDKYGNLTIDGNLDNSANIKQNNVTITSGTTTNDATITAENIVVKSIGALTNNGTASARDLFSNWGTISNSGIIISSTNFINEVGGNLTNSGDIVSVYFQNSEKAENSGMITSSWRFYNLKEFKNLSGGSIVAKEINNKNSFEDAGAIIYNEQNALIQSTSIINRGTIESTGTIIADEIINYSDATITNYSSGTITAVTIVNAANAILNNYAGGVIESTSIINYGTIGSTGTITAGTIENGAFATLNNYEGGVIESTSIVNRGIINTTGTITASEIKNMSGASITNFDNGTITADGGITNEGTLTSNADGIIATVFNTGTYNVTGGTVSYDVTGATGGTVNIETDAVTVAADTYISQNEIYVSTGLKLLDETALKTSTLIIKDGAVISTQNDKIGTLNPDEIIIDATNWTYSGFDVNLKTAESDNLTNISSVASGSKATINDIHLLSDKASKTLVQIATTDINAQVSDPVNIYTSSLTYSVTTVNNDYDGDKFYEGSWLKIEADGYGGLPAAVYDGANFYDVTVDTDVVTKWIEDGDGIHDTLKTGLAIDGHGKIITTANLIAGDPETDYLSGLKTSSYTLTINNVAEWSGFTDAISVNDVDGNLIVKDVTFSSNTGNAVIASSGIVTLNNVTFDQTNTATVDVANDGEMLLTGAATTFNKGISGNGTTTIKGVAIDMTDKTLAQRRIDISDIAGSSLTASVKHTNVDLFMNDGALVLLGNDTSAETLSSEINGIGNTTISEGTVITKKNIAQTNVYLSNALVMVSSTVKATTIDVDGTSSLVADADNIDTFAAGGKVANAGTVEFTGGTNKNIIDGDGMLKITGNVINSTGAAITQNLIKVESDSFETSANDITTTDGIENGAELILTGGTLAASNAITSSGNLTVTGDLVNNANIEQRIVTISSGTTEHNGSIQTTGTGIVIEDGAKLVAHGEINTYKNAVNPDNAFIDNSGILEIDIAGTVIPDQIKSGNKIKGNGTFILTRGGFNTYDDIEDRQGSIEQTSIIISSNAILTSSLTAVTTTDGIISAGTINFAVNEDETAANNNLIRGNGVLNFAGGTVTNNADIQQNEINVKSGLFENNDGIAVEASTITVASAGGLTANADDIQTTKGIINKGVVTFTGGINRNAINYGGKGSAVGIVNIESDVTNCGGINQEIININNGMFTNGNGSLILVPTINITSNNAGLTANAGDISPTITSAQINNAGDLIFTGGINSNTIDGYDGNYGSLTIDGNVINEDGKAITQSSVTVNDGATFTANVSDITTTGDGILNNGEMIFVSDDSSKMTNDNVITGDNGNLTVKCDLQNNKSITQNNINILNGIFEHSAYDSVEVTTITANNIVISTSATLITHNVIIANDKIINNGIFEINVNSEGTSIGDEAVKNPNEIEGSGELKIISTTFANTDKNIKQSTITIDSDSSLRSDVNNITAYEKIQSAGALILQGDGTNKNTIEGYDGTEGYLVVDGNIINSTGTAISQSSITVASGSFETSANDITTTDGIVNEAELTLTGGTLIASNAITGSGNLAVTGDLQNNAAIDQNNITVTSNYFDNVSGSSITANKLTATTRFMTDAADLNISDSIDLTSADTMLQFRDTSATVSTITANITGSGYLVQEGAATVVLSGTNDYTGTTTITDGALQISSADNISKNTIYADGGTLIVNTDNGDVSLSNEIIGTDHNNVNIEVEGTDNSTILDGIILGNEDLVKTGEGILDLQMAENKYAGDTIITSGTVRGTTANINGIVTGTGEGSNVEFYDESGEVTLNEIADMGGFAKTGAAEMTVDKAFKAVTAEISSGTFIINNADVDGKKITTFKVDSTMTVTNALLKGYSNIEAKDLIIGSGATFAPGNSTATINLTGNLKFEDDGTYDVEMGQVSMEERGHYNDNTNVGGTTAIGDDAKLVITNLEGKYYLDEKIAIITGGVTEANYKDENITFNDNDAIGLRAGFDTRISTTVYAQGNNLMVKLERKASDYANATEFKKSHNEQEAATSIDAISQGNGGDITSALDTLEKFYYYETTYSTDSLKAALNDVAGVIHANATNLTKFNAKAEHVYDKIKERTLDLYPCTKFHDKIWAEYYYNNYNVDKDDNSPKYETNVNGFLVGFDALSAKGWTLGIMAGYGTSELKQVSDKATMKDINAGLYGGYEGSKWSFKSMLLGGYESYDISREISFMERRASSEHKGYSGALDAELGYKISLNKQGSTAKHKMYLRPFIGATGSYINNEGYEEKGAEDLNLKIEGYDTFSAEARAGLGINGKVKKFGWYAKVGARQLLTDKYNEIETSLLNFSDTTKMKIRSAENSQTTLTGGIGADYQLSDAWTIFANGLGNFADKSTNYYANVGLAYKFGCINNKPKTETNDKEVERLSKLLNNQAEKENLLNKKIEARNKALEAKQKELDDAKAREKELQNRIQKYEANIVSEKKAAKLKERALKQIKLKNKPTFFFGTAKLTKKGKAALAQVVEELKQYPEDSEVLVEGYTDSVGPDDVNQKLSEDRAATIAKTLKKDYNVKNNINVIGKGEKEPIASNKTAEGRAKNRRVEILITAPVDDETSADEEDIEDGVLVDVK